jgi:hypothetical protein
VEVYLKVQDGLPGFWGQYAGSTDDHHRSINKV